MAVLLSTLLIILRDMEKICSVGLTLVLTTRRGVSFVGVCSNFKGALEKSWPTVKNTNFVPQYQPPISSNLFTFVHR